MGNDKNDFSEKFVGIVSHDLKNPINSILFNVSAAQRFVPPGSEGEKLCRRLSNIERLTHSMNRMINGLLDSANIQSGKFPINKSVTSLKALMYELMEDFLPIAEANDQILNININEDISINCDKDRIYQVFSNLISNAIKWTPKKESIKVAWVKSNNNLQFCISNTGSTIAKKSFKKIFEQFFRGENNPENGLGLGLFIAKWIVEEHQGKIWVESESNQTTFYFTLPL